MMIEFVHMQTLTILDVENPNKTAVGLFVDKEEIGSVGAAAMEGLFLKI